MSQPSHGADGSGGRVALSFAVRLTDAQTEPLALGSEDGHVVATARSVGLNQSAVIRWLERHEIPLLAGTPAHEAPEELPLNPLLRLNTLVVCLDPCVRDIAELYARSVDASFRLAQTPEEVCAQIEQAEPHESVTLFLLNNRLEEPLCQAVATANRRRDRPLSYGFLSAFTPEQLAWLVIKSWVLFLRSPAEYAGFAQWDFSGPGSVARVRSAQSGATRVQPIDAPWTADFITVLGLRAHGAQFDASMGKVVLCGQLDPPLARERTLRAPSCFHDSVCFRMKAPDDAPTARLRAVDASPLVWCLDSCASIPLTGSAFGEGTSYAFGLIAGAAVGVIGPFLDITSRGTVNRLCEALLATGATLGQAVAAACALEPTHGFDKFLLLGSPDLRLLPPSRVEARREGEKLRYPLRGERQYAWRLAVPPDFKGPAYVVGDDGGRQWGNARCHWVEDGTNRDLVVTLDEPTDVDGWLLVGYGGKGHEQLGQEAAQILDNLNVLVLLPFVDPGAETIERCRMLARFLRRITQSPDRLRCRFDAAILLANLHAALDVLHQQTAGAFLAQVAAHDVNLDRITSHGFDLEPTARTTERCPTCEVALYVTQARWREKRSYLRRWVQCVNCSGLSMVLEDSPLEIVLPVAKPNPDETSLSVALEIRNRSTDPIEALVAGLARQGSPAHAAGPVVLTIPPGSIKSLHFSAPLDPSLPGVTSYRFLVLCRAAIELVAFKYVLEPAVRRA